MGKNKLHKFAEMEALPNVFQCPMRDINDDNEVVCMAGHWRERYFRNDNPIVLELGCGHGDYTVGLARLNPDRNFIGIDIKGARMWQGAKQADAEGLANVAFLRINIEWLQRFFAADEVDEIWITFPDPQMKKATKRLTSTHFLKRYYAILKPDAPIHLKTDSPFLYTYTREMLNLNSFPILADTDNLYEQQGLQWGEAQALQTHYEHQWLERGMNIRYLCWRMERKENLIEPETEIEKDTYRSYGRYAR